MSNGAELHPITESDAFIADALRDASIPALMASMSHLVGDLRLWDSGIRPAAAPFGPVDNDGLTEEQREAVRAQALELLKDYRDRGSPALPPFDSDALLKMMRLVAGDAVPDSYLPMLLADARIDDRPIALREWPAALKEKAGDFHALVVGAGMSGMLMAIRLQEAGIPYVIIEKNSDVGGTWLLNSYPGCRCDVPNYFYSYSFERRSDWPHHFSERDRILEYFQGIAQKYNILSKVQFNSEVTEAVWSEEESTWHVSVCREDGSVDMIVTKAFIPAVGQLSRPKIPDLPGAERFGGIACHTGAYDRSISYEGKRVAVVGTAASAIQAIPEIAEKADQLFVVQRTAHWLLPSPNHLAEIAPGMKWLLGHVPFYSHWYRARYSSRSLYGLKIAAAIDPSWPHQERSVSALNDQVRERLTDYLKGELDDRPDLLEKLTPKYPPFATRIMPNNGSYLRSLKRDNSELVTGNLAALDETGIVMADGRHLDVDIIIYATGFQATRFMYPMRIVGKGGVVLSDFWGEDARAYLGIAVPNFPNMFMVFGPGTAVFNVIFLAECNSRYIMDAVQGMIENGWDTIECRPEIYTEYVERYRREAAGLAIASPHVTSWYKSASGNVVSNLPFEVSDYWNWTRKANFEDYLTSCENERGESLSDLINC
ncbi:MULTISPECIES: flavin-containing monooxygenase [Sphingobium]|uniref:flavin-containing monooxygenase n=1 Tax=Sphingobium TaxID=165695 RepID=UPI00159C303C|nr:NAD(P)/FAD-dependent oxidoreductase [Sphingobium sp. 15-1]